MFDLGKPSLSLSLFSPSLLKWKGNSFKIKERTCMYFLSAPFHSAVRWYVLMSFSDSGKGAVGYKALIKQASQQNL